MTQRAKRAKSDPTMTGYRTQLPQDRSVFLGRVGHEGSWYLEFVNAEGTVTQLKLSEAAFTALYALRTKRLDGSGQPYKPHKPKTTQWVVVNPDTGSERPFDPQISSSYSLAD